MIRQDLHIHTKQSLCASAKPEVKDYVANAKAMGLKVIAFTDHMWDNTVPGASSWYQRQDFAHISEIRGDIPASDDRLKILFGCETECDQCGTVGISRELASQLDILLVPNSHTHMKDFVMPAALREDSVKHGAFMVKHFMDIMNSPVAEYITAIPHPFAAVCCPTAQEVMNSIPDAELMECFRAAKQNNIAMEINTSSYTKMTEEEIRQSSFIRLYSLAREIGCTFTIGSDAHAIPEQYTLQKAEIVMEASGITEDMLLRL